MPAYEAFAGLYDTLMDDVDYDAWAGYYMELIRQAGVQPRTLCDCACGTGSMSARFAEMGLKVTGVDLSGEMLERARQKALERGVRAMFVCQDMCALALPRPVDALVCACDGVNYLLDDGRLNAFFERAQAAIRPGGALAFDISSPWKLEHILGDSFFGEDREDVTYLWANHFDSEARTVTMELTFFVERSDGLYRRFDETHVQKAHDPRHLAALMEQNGFSDVKVYGDRTFEAPAPDAQRLHLIATRE